MMPRTRRRPLDFPGSAAAFDALRDMTDATPARARDRLSSPARPVAATKRSTSRTATSSAGASCGRRSRRIAAWRRARCARCGSPNGSRTRNRYGTRSCAATVSSSHASTMLPTGTSPTSTGRTVTTSARARDKLRSGRVSRGDRQRAGAARSSVALSRSERSCRDGDCHLSPRLGRKIRDRIGRERGGAMAFDTIIRGGTVATAADTFACDIGIKDGGSRRSAPISATPPRSWTRPASWCCPAASTATCIFASRPGPASSMADDFESGTRAAAFGGNTMVLPFAMQQKGESLREVVKALSRQGRRQLLHRRLVPSHHRGPDRPRAGPGTAGAGRGRLHIVQGVHDL